MLKTRPDWQLLCGLILIIIAINAWLTSAAGFELHYDEAQYWEWSQQLDWSYYSKGPLVAWLIALAGTLFGHGEWQVRLFAWLTQGIFMTLLFLFTRQVWNSRTAAWWAVLITLTTPLYFTLGLVMTTDVFLFACWTWGLWAIYRALNLNQSRAWYELGAAIGIGALVKLSIGLLPAISGILVMVIPRWRHHLLNPHVWGGLGVMLICMAPMLWWNLHHDWMMFRHELGHVDYDQWSLLRLIVFILGQWIALSPIVVLVAVVVLRRVPLPMRQRLLWLISLVCVIFFVLKAGSAKVQLNWPAPSYIGFIVLFAGAVPFLSSSRRRMLVVGMVASLMLMVLGYFPYAFGISAKIDPLKAVKVWRQPVTAISSMSPQPDFILTDKYELAAELAFYWPKRLPVYITGNAARRFNQHDLWPRIDREAGRNALYISTNPAPPPQLERAFNQCHELQPVVAHAPDGYPLRTLYVRYCLQYVSIIWPMPQYY
jgi:4-amino-4-deoxy-L-arabinose transferase-like glycosyltransferase